MTIWLKPLALSEQHIVDAIELDADQQRFAGGSIADIFKALRASAFPQFLHPFAVVAGEQIVGFLVLRERDALPTWAHQDSITLHSFRISAPFQHKGFGGTALTLAASWIRTNRPAVSFIMLTVNADNPGADALYLRCGFQPTGAIFQGRIGRERVLRCPVRKLSRSSRPSL